jgi:hypothetical protein
MNNMFYVIFGIGLLSLAVIATIYTLNRVYAQVTTPEQLVELCTPYNTELLKIISLESPCFEFGTVIEHWLSAGYKIVSATNGMVFMTK